MLVKELISLLSHVNENAEIEVALNINTFAEIDNYVWLTNKRNKVALTFTRTQEGIKL